MLYRILLTCSPVANLIDGATLYFLAGYQAYFAFISDNDWAKITGPHGLVFVLVVGLIVIWTKSLRDDAARERRHREAISSQEEHFKLLINLNEKATEDLKVLTVASTKAQMSATNAIISMDHNIIRLTNELSDQAKISVRKARLAKRLDQQEATE